MNQITYNVEVAELKAFQRHHRKTSTIYRRIRIVMLILFSAFSLYFSLHNAPDGIVFHVTYFLVVLAALLVWVTIFSYVVTYIALFRAYKEGYQHGVLGEHTITLTPDALYERTQVSDAKTAWAGIFRIDSTAKHIFIYTQPNAAHVIPRRAFPSPDDSEAFLATARQYHKINEATNR